MTPIVIDLAFSRPLALDDRETVADLLSTLASDIKKGVGGFGVRYQIVIPGDR